VCSREWLSSGRLGQGLSLHRNAQALDGRLLLGAEDVALVDFPSVMVLVEEAPG
jgi:hypothetical protein